MNTVRLDKLDAAQAAHHGALIGALGCSAQVFRQDRSPDFREGQAGRGVRFSKAQALGEQDRPGRKRVKGAPYSAPHKIGRAGTDYL
jgi:hypothetical protein